MGEGKGRGREWSENIGVTDSRRGWRMIMEDFERHFWRLRIERSEVELRNTEWGKLGKRVVTRKTMKWNVQSGEATWTIPGRSSVTRFFFVWCCSCLRTWPTSKFVIKTNTKWWIKYSIQLHLKIIWYHYWYYSKDKILYSTAINLIRFVIQTHINWFVNGTLWQLHQFSL